MIRAMNDTVIVVPIPPSEQVSSGGLIFIPDIAKDNDKGSDFGTVIAVGPKVTELKVGDVVWFLERVHDYCGKPYHPKQLNIGDGKLYLGLKQSDIKLVRED